MRYFAIWVVLLAVDVFLVKDPAFIVHKLSERFWVNYGLSALVLLLFLLFAVNLKKKYLYWVLTLPLLIESAYFGIYRDAVDAFGVISFFTDTWMVTKLYWENIPWLKSLLILWVMWKLMYFVEPLRLSKLVKIPLAIILTLLFLLTSLSWYATPSLQHAIVAFYGALVDTTKVISYQKTQVQRPDLAADPRPDLPNMIFVVGESMVVKHMSLYGYDKKTTPQLDKLAEEGLIIPFENVTSIGTLTRLSVPYMLVGLQGIDPQGIIYHYPTVLDYMKSVGYETILLTSQDLGWGELDSFLVDKNVDYFVNGTKYNPDANVHKGTDDKLMLKQEILPIIQGAKKPFFMVFQMDGSHYPYNLHSPKEEKIWPEPSPNSVGAYDNSIHYSDKVLGRMVRALRAQYPDAWLFFSTDHGQAFDDQGAHFSQGFANGVIHNAFFISPPKAYYAQLKALQKAPISQADIVATILDILGIKPVMPLDGLSLLKPIPQDRLRVVSTYMPTLHNVPKAALVFPDFSVDIVDFLHQSVTLATGKTIPWEAFDARYQAIFLPRLVKNMAPKADQLAGNQ